MTEAVDALDAYIAQLSRHLTVTAATREMIVEETRSHLEEAVAQAMARDVDRPTAEARALAAFGPAPQVAARYNTVHPLDWDARRFGIGVLWGIGLSWLIWTAVTFPFLVQRAIQMHAQFPNGDYVTPGSLLFAATPLSFGLMKVLEFNGFLIVMPLLALFSVVPLLWGWRAQRGWQPGLAFGLGVVVGFPWLLPGLIYYWGSAFGFPLDLIIVVIGIWLLCPYAMLMSWVGQRLAARRSRRASTRVARSNRGTGLDHYRHAIPYMAFGVMLVALLAINIWSWQQAAQLAPPPALQQLAIAQAHLAFPLRQPTNLPPHFMLSQATVATADQNYGHCSQCYVTLIYHDDKGNSINLDEWRLPPNTPDPYPDFAPPAFGYAVQVGSVGESDHVWWLGIETKQIQEINVKWTLGGIYYSLVSESSSPSTFSADQLKQIAATM